VLTESHLLVVDLAAHGEAKPLMTSSRGAVTSGSSGHLISSVWERNESPRRNYRTDNESKRVDASGQRSRPCLVSWRMPNPSVSPYRHVPEYGQSARLSAMLGRSARGTVRVMRASTDRGVAL